MPVLPTTPPPCALASTSPRPCLVLLLQSSAGKGPGGGSRGCGYPTNGPARAVRPVFRGSPCSAESRRNAASPPAPRDLLRGDRATGRPRAPRERSGDVGQRRDVNIKGSKRNHIGARDLWTDSGLQHPPRKGSLEAAADGRCFPGTGPAAAELARSELQQSEPHPPSCGRRAEAEVQGLPARSNGTAGAGASCPGSGAEPLLCRRGTRSQAPGSGAGTARPLPSTTGWV